MYELSAAIGVAILIRAGQTMLLVGSVRSKNAAGMAVRCLLDLAVVILAAWALAAVFYPSSEPGATKPLLAINFAFGNADGIRKFLIVVMLPYLFIHTAATVGATAERVRLLPVLLLSACAAAVLLPLTDRIGSKLMAAGQYPHAGLSTAVVGGGAAALAMAFVAGARKDKFNRDQSANFVPGHAVPLQAVGMLLMTAGWCGAMPNAVHGLLGLSAGLLGGTAFGRVKFLKIDFGLLLAAAIGGLAAGGLAAAPQSIEPRFGSGGAASVIAGGIAGVLVPWVLIRLETVWRIDDVAGLGSSYFVGGTVGMLIAMLLRPAGMFASGLLWVPVVWLMAVVVFGGTAFAIGKFFALRGKLRVGESTEYDGLDLSDLDVNAYPDFQQTMIKSHHLRQL